MRTETGTTITDPLYVRRAIAMAIRESNLVKHIRNVLLEAGAYVVKVHGSQFGPAGTSDLLVCLRGRFLAIEVKVPGRERTLTALQAHALAEVRAAGGYAGVMTSAEAAADLTRYWPFVCRHCLSHLISDGGDGLLCPGCKEPVTGL